MSIASRLFPQKLQLLPIYAVIYVAVLYLPVLILPVFSFNDSKVLSFPLTGFTTKWYAQLADQTALLGSLRHSLSVALATAVFSTLLGTFVARAIVKYRFPFRKAAQVIVMVPLVMPEIIVAISLLILLLGLGLNPSLMAVTAAHILMTIPFCVSIMTSAFGQFDDSLEEAAIDLGESSWGAMTKVTLPVVAPGLLSSALVSFTVSFDEFILSFFLSGNSPTLPVYIWSQVRFPAKLPIVLALGSVIILMSLILLITAEYFRRRNLRMVIKPEGNA